MKALDTNVLVRFLVKDDPLQAAQVHHLLKQHEARNEMLYIPLIVIMELIWVLQAAYQVNREEIVGAINDLMSMPLLEFEQQSAVRAFVQSAKETTYDLSDLLIALSARQGGCESTLTFDNKASRFELFEKIA
ncbi:MAG: type II toxin-antitoxin system VapC family toxin [Gammaproteobacteria bacterium]|nr:type II toxin-antitoxin system VapC family toxin [Gammaproteobacteria bacterium]